MYRRSAVDSGSRTASFTRAEESRYVACSALIASEPGEHLRWRLLIGSQRKRKRQVVQVVLARDEVTRGLEVLHRPLARERGEDRYRAAAVGDLDGLSSLNSSQQLARPLAKFAHTHARHVLVVAHLSPSLVYRLPTPRRSAVLGGDSTIVGASTAGVFAWCHLMSTAATTLGPAGPATTGFAPAFSVPARPIAFYYELGIVVA
jgi:hypothetical protein